MPGCIARRADLTPPAPVAVAVEPPRPPADLLTCADRPAALVEDSAMIATIPGAWRAGFIGLARAAGVNADRLDRLTNWIVPGTCPAKE
ncbi:hypothetical protein QE363_000741 [Sphingomonas sp. SORGH_AS870]|uniref:hypothetical protein n=1 Tax=Sphingomonas sp. SORGH_AS_0870 TaxID=3041801 RepID=UPI00285A1F80|nr:hypothetical protein [Sphingomonas sp. SORGH_AS_0870]MDR6144948.1 hypothetical protein [Sphingomonas sp. SORGH_AS_0870]